MELTRIEGKLFYQTCLWHWQTATDFNANIICIPIFFIALKSIETTSCRPRSLKKWKQKYEISRENWECFRLFSSFACNTLRFARNRTGSVHHISYRTASVKATQCIQRTQLYFERLKNTFRFTLKVSANQSIAREAKHGQKHLKFLSGSFEQIFPKAQKLAILGLFSWVNNITWPWVPLILLPIFCFNNLIQNLLMSSINPGLPDHVDFSQYCRLPILRSPST